MRAKPILLLALIALAGCDDLKIESADSFRFGGSLPARLTYKGADVPEDRVTCTWLADGRVVGTGTAVVVSGLGAGKHALEARVTFDGKTGDVKRTIRVENDAPVVTIAPAATRYPVGAPIDVAATATDREDGTAAVTWQVDGKDRALPVADLAPGKHALVALATDRAGATGRANLEVEVTNEAPRVTIESAALETRVYRAVELRGFATDPDPLRGPARIPVDRLEWVSSKQGSLGQGESLTITTLVPGEHLIELRAKDEFGAIGNATVKVVVLNDAPLVTIKRPRSSEEVPVGEKVRFECDASDPEDANFEDGRVTWRSQLDGELGHGRTLETKRLRPGLHEIRCVAVDRFGATGSDRIELVVRNDPPAVRIESPADGASVGARDKVELRASGEAEDFDWFAGDRKLGSGLKIKVDGLKIGFGNHELRLRARSKFGAEATTSVRVTVVRKPLEVTITSPADGTSFPQGAEVVLAGFARDVDRDEKVRDLTWTTVYNLAEQSLGTGERLVLRTLGPGVHQLTLTARDQGVTRVATVRIRITAPTTGIVGSIPGN